MAKHVLGVSVPAEIKLRLDELARVNPGLSATTLGAIALQAGLDTVEKAYAPNAAKTAILAATKGTSK